MQRFLLFPLITSSFFLMNTSASAAPSTIPAIPLQVVRQVQVDMPAADTWALIQDFGQLHDWHPGVIHTRIVSGTDNTPGALRELTLPNGDALFEQMTEFEPARMRFAYIITKGTLPIRDYSSRMSVTALGDNKSRIDWDGTFVRADPAEKPASGKDDAAAVQTVAAVFDSGLASIGRIATDRKAIQQVIGWYADGGTRGDPKMVARAFHPSATLKFVRDGTLVDEPIEVFFRDYIRSGVAQKRTVHTDRIDIQGSAASARLTIDYPTHKFVDYFNLLKIDGHWLIVSKIFHRMDKGAQPTR